MYTVELPSGKQVGFTLPILDGRAALEYSNSEGYTQEELVVATSITSINGVAVVGTIELLMGWESRDIQYLLEYFSVVNYMLQVQMGGIQYTDPRPVAPRKRAIIGEESRAHAQKQARQLMVPAWDVVG